MSDQNIILNDGHSEAEAGVEEEDQHEDVVEDSIAIIVRTAQVTSGGCETPYPVPKDKMVNIVSYIW